MPTLKTPCTASSGIPVGAGHVYYTRTLINRSRRYSLAYIESRFTVIFKMGASPLPIPLACAPMHLPATTGHTMHSYCTMHTEMPHFQYVTFNFSFFSFTNCFHRSSSCFCLILNRSHGFIHHVHWFRVHVL